MMYLSGAIEQQVTVTVTATVTSIIHYKEKCVEPFDHLDLLCLKGGDSFL